MMTSRLSLLAPILLLVPLRLIGAEPPADVLDLSSWLLTMPIDSDRAGSPDEIKQPELAAFQSSQFFYVNGSADDSKRTVVFRAPCGGSTTKGSRYPRCELREMTDSGRTRASWSTADQIAHTMGGFIAV